MKKIEICFSPALFSSYDAKDSVVIIVDIFRATTSICAGFYNGLIAVKTVTDIEEAKKWKAKGYLTAAERNTQKVDFADFGNSPFDFTKEKVQGKQLVFTTTNGTQAVETAKNADEIVVGAFSNIEILKEYYLKSEKNILVLCSGWNNKFCIEDTLFAGALAEKLIESKKYTHHSDSVKISLDIWNIAKKNLLSYVKQTEHYERLINNGLENSVEYCLTNNTAPVIPKYNKLTDSFELF
ncbi:MAG: 2-phosphosulfolactate phosphatase [Paludibacteraceae bacterium]